MSLDFLNLGRVDPWIIVKIPVVILLALYVVFAFVVVRQTRIMTNTLEIGLEVPIKILSYLHFLFALFLFLFALTVL
ncbi:hypothetical protein HYS03_00505 [Candidatus Woesebacteria bacterium]|nr:hypothetical protein [Candidatus Woesebacteria bacterium]QQG47629.1 MAG: hypothetical protein HY044_00905 [Candidatus Woesebacteria bacterium]